MISSTPATSPCSCPTTATSSSSTSSSSSSSLSILEEANGEMEGKDSEKMEWVDDEDLREHVEAQLLTATTPILGPHGRSALHRAARRGLGEVVAKLLAACSVSLIDEVDDNGRTAFDYAVNNGHAAIVTQLLAAKPALIDEINWDSVADLEIIVAANPRLLERYESEGCWTDLHLAAYRGQAEVVAHLLSADPDAIDEVTNKGLTALHWAARGGHTATVALLLTANPDLIEEVTNGEFTPFEFAVFAGHAGVVAQLLSLDPALLSDGTAFYDAAASGHEGVVAQFIAANPALVELAAEEALFGAARGGHRRVVAQLLAAKPSLIDALGENETALHVAAQGGHEGVVALLLALRPSLVCKVTSWGWTVLHYAAEGGNSKIFSQLLAVVNREVSSELSEQFLLRRSTRSFTSMCEGSTALHVAAFHGCSKVATQLLAACPTLIDVLDDNRRTCLHCAVSRGPCEATVNALLALKPDLVHAVDSEGNTILHAMVTYRPYGEKFKSKPSRRELVEKVWKLNLSALHAVNRSGDTPFHCALRVRNDNAITALQWSLTFDEVMSAYAKCKESYKARLRPLMEVQCEDLVAAGVLIRDVVDIVFEYLGL